MTKPMWRLGTLSLGLAVALGCGGSDSEVADAAAGADAALEDVGAADVGGDASVNPDSGPGSPPNAPLQLEARLTTRMTVVLTWVDASTDEIGFAVRRRCGGGSGDFGWVGQTAADETSFEDLDPVRGETCNYRVLAQNTHGWSAAAEAAVEIPPHRFALVVHKSVSGHGVVTQTQPDDDDPIHCGSVCSKLFDAGTTVTLIAAPARGSLSGAWDGCDESGGGTCIVTLNDSREVLARFESPLQILAPEVGHVDGNGDYLLVWSTSRPCAHAAYSVEEAPDETFTEITFNGPGQAFGDSRGEQRFRKTTDGTHCYRVSCSGLMNWSRPRCVQVALTPVTLPRTGQTRSYRAGDDGLREKGVTWPAPRFTNPGDGTIVDELTGLMWLRDTNCMNTHHPDVDATATAGDGAVGWNEALAFVAGMNAGLYPACALGHSDWRLPNHNELLPMVPVGAEDAEGWLRQSGFDIAETEFWTSTSQPDYADYALTISLQTLTNTRRKTVSTGHLLDPPSVFVWPVRTARADQRTVARTGQERCFSADGEVIDCAGTGQDAEIRAGVARPTPRFVDRGDETILDAMTGLIWLADADCVNTHYPNLAPGFGGGGDWVFAIDFVNHLNEGRYPFCSAGYDDWRLPNVYELLSLFDFGTPLDRYASDVGIANADVSGFWSSTTSRLNPSFDAAFYVILNASSAPAYTASKSWMGGHVWPVRGGD